MTARDLALTILAAAKTAPEPQWSEGHEQRVAAAADRVETERDMAAVGLSDGPRWVS